MTTIEILNQAKLDYESRIGDSKYGLCSYLGDGKDKSEIISKINSLITVGVWYKGVLPYNQLEYYDNVTPEGIEDHYKARLELIHILIAHFKKN